MILCILRIGDCWPGTRSSLYRAVQLNFSPKKHQSLPHIVDNLRIDVQHNLPFLLPVQIAKYSQNSACAVPSSSPLSYHRLLDRSGHLSRHFCRPSLVICPGFPSMTAGRHVPRAPVACLAADGQSSVVIELKAIQSFRDIKIHECCSEKESS